MYAIAKARRRKADEARRPTKPRLIFGRDKNRKIPLCYGGIVPLNQEGYGLSKKDKPYYFDPQKWKYEKLVAMTNAAIQRKNAEFAEAHRNDTNRQLIAYLRQCARELGYTPYPSEVFGGAMINQRFGGWSRAVVAAGLPYPTHKVSKRGRRIYHKTMKEQSRIFDEQLAQKREAIRAANSEKVAAAQAEKQTRLERDARWGEAHGNMSDNEILDYLRTCAETLGHSPYSYEVEGGRYIAERFVSWSIALTEAGLSLPKGIQKPRQEQKLEFQARKSGCQPGNDPEAYID